MILREFSSIVLLCVSSIIIIITIIIIIINMSKSTKRWIEAAWRRETIKEENALVMLSVKTMEEVGARLRFEGKSIKLGDEVID